MRRLLHTISTLVPPFVRRAARKRCSRLYHRLYDYAYATDAPAEQTIQSGPLAGRRFVCRPLVEPHYWQGTYEPAVQAAAGRYIRPGAVVYDIGVHRGYFTLLFATLVGESGRVIGFEPQPANLALIRRNVALSADLTGRIQLIDRAVAATTGTAQFVEVEEYSSMGRLGDAGAGGRPVETVSLDDFVAAGNPPPRFIKMDIEGAETQAFGGMRRVLSEGRPVLLVELHDESAWAAFKGLLREYDYRGARLGDGVFSREPAWAGREQYLAVPRAEAPV